MHLNIRTNNEHINEVLKNIIFVIGVTFNNVNKPNLRERSRSVASCDEATTLNIATDDCQR